MPNLTVSQFSCINYANIDVSPLTLIIGPQASGKSVICKLIYFFYDALLNKLFEIEECNTWKDFSNRVVSDFKQWFPQNAWGKKKFHITFNAGPVELSIVRTISSNRPGNNVRLVSSNFVKDQFEKYCEMVSERRRKLATKASSSVPEIQNIWRMEILMRRNLERELKDDYFSTQTFVPAGRSFFTSMGKAVTAFERGGLLDPVTVSFGRFFTVLRERWNRRVHLSEETQSQRRLIARRQSLALRFFGGEVKVDGEKEYVDSSDGRKIPFSILSSGQQELLPLWMTLEFSAEQARGRHLFYIEEPEAHLFPTAQSALVEYLASIINSNEGLRLIITTHSPYVLSKFNNFLKAYMLSSKQDISKSDIVKIIPQVTWLDPTKARAYAMIDGECRSIIDDDGLINGEYIDTVSGEIAEEFSRLLEIEYR